MVDKKRKADNSWAIFLALGFSLGWAGLAIYILDLGVEKINPRVLGINEIGDFLAGWFAPLAFGWFVYTAFMQRHELEQTREELQNHTQQFRKNQIQNEISNLMNLLEKKSASLPKNIINNMYELHDELKKFHIWIDENENIIKEASEIKDLLFRLEFFNFNESNFFFSSDEEFEVQFELMSMILTYSKVVERLRYSSDSAVSPEWKEKQKEILHLQISLNVFRGTILNKIIEMESYFSQLEDAFMHEAVAVAKNNSSYGKLLDELNHSKEKANKFISAVNLYGGHKMLELLNRI